MKRRVAIEIASALGSIPIGYFGEDDLDSLLHNISVLGKVAEDVRRMNEELNKRLYEGIAPERKRDCFTMLAKADEAKARLRNASSSDEAKKIIAEINEFSSEVKSKYADVWEIYLKHSKAYERLIEKEVEVEIIEMDADAFVKAVVKGRKELPVAEIRTAFAPLFTAVEEEFDTTEIDNLINNL